MRSAGYRLSRLGGGMVGMDEDDDMVEIRRQVDMSELSWPARDRDLTDDSGVGCNRLYIDLRRMPWSEARRVLEIEEVHLLREDEVAVSGDIAGGKPEQEVRQRPTNDDTDVDNDDDEDDELYEELYGLDLGVASAVLALSAAGCIPFASCNGGPGHLELYPVVVCWARVQRVLDLLEVAEEAGCGLENANDGAVLVYADDVHKMLAFARILIGRRKGLRKIGRPRASKPPHSESAPGRATAAQLDLPFPSI